MIRYRTSVQCESCVTVFPVIDVDPLDPLAGPTFGGPFCRGFFTFAIDDSPILAVRAAARRAVQRIVKAGAQAAFASQWKSTQLCRQQRFRGLRFAPSHLAEKICQMRFVSFFLEKTLPRMGSVAGLCGSVQRVALP